MRKLLFLSIAMVLPCIVLAQNVEQYFNSIYPIQGTVTTEYPEFTATKIEMSYEWMGKEILLSDRIYLYKGAERYLGQTIENIKYHSNIDLGAFISFNYISKFVPNISGHWNNSSSTTQFAFHPGGLGKEANYKNAEKPYYVPLYAFTYSDTEGLNLIDVNSGNVIAKIGEGGDITKYAYLAVLAGDSRSSKDIIVVAGKSNFSVFGIFVGDGESSVRSISYSGAAPSYFDINGQRLDSPKQGINIVVDGETTRKVVVK